MSLGELRIDKSGTLLAKVYWENGTEEGNTWVSVNSIVHIESASEHGRPASLIDDNKGDLLHMYVIIYNCIFICLTFISLPSILHRFNDN